MKKLLALLVALLISVVAFAGVDLNSADEAALKEVKGIGKITAQAIIAERDANGPFKDYADLAKRVKGVGKKTIEKLKEAGMDVGSGAASDEKPE